MTIDDLAPVIGDRVSAAARSLAARGVPLEAARARVIAALDRIPSTPLMAIAELDALAYGLGKEAA